MLVKFWTRHGQLTMLGEPAVALIRLGGHSGAVPGAVLGAELPGFLERLRTGLDSHGDEISPAPAPDSERGAEDEPRERPIRLRHRAVPLLEMLQTAIERESDLMWDRV